MSKVTLGDKNRITLPKDLIPEGVSRFELGVDDEGRIILTPLIEVPADQLWFWSKKWQQGERQASSDIKEGRIKQANSEQIMSEIRQRRKTKK